MVSEIRFSKEEEEEDEEEHGQSVKFVFYLYFTPPVIFSSIFLHAVTFSHVLHLDVLRRQIELKLKATREAGLLQRREGASRH